MNSKMELQPASRINKFVPWLLVFLSAGLAVAAYLQALNYQFISDDATYVTENTTLARLGVTELWRLFTGRFNSLEFLPLRDLSYWFDISIFGLNPSAFRIHNIVLYLLCLPLIYGVTLELWRYFRLSDNVSGPWAAAVVTALFALHPAHVEAVVWISGRKDLLSALFSLLAIWLAVLAKRDKGISTPYAATALLTLLAAMLSKAPSVAVAPLIALLWVLFYLDIPAMHRRRSQLLWPITSLLLAACIAIIFTANSTIKEPAYFGVEATTRTMASLGWLARLAVSPEGRHYFYPVFEDPYLPVMVTLGLVILIAAIAGAVMILRKRSLERFALAIFFLLCIPYIQPISYETPTLVADRWLMLAVWPIIILLVAWSWRLKPVFRAIIFLVIALSWAFQSIERPREWRNPETLIEADLNAYPGHYLPALLKISGVQLPTRKYRDAAKLANGITVPEFRDVMTMLIKTDYAVNFSAGKPDEIMNHLKQIELILKQPPEQVKWNSPARYLWDAYGDILMNQWNTLTEHFPNDVLVRYNTGLWNVEIHRYLNSIDYLRAATESQRLPESERGVAYKSLGLALMKSGYAVKAESPLLSALEQSPPDLQAYCILSSVYKMTNRVDEAERADVECRKQFSNERVTQ